MGKIRTLNMEQYYANKEALSKQSKAEQRAEATRLATPIPPRREKLHMTKEQMEQREHFLEQRRRSRYKNRKVRKGPQVTFHVSPKKEFFNYTPKGMTQSHIWSSAIETKRSKH